MPCFMDFAGLFCFSVPPRSCFAGKIFSEKNVRTAVVLGLAVLGVILLRVYLESRHEVKMAQTYLKKGEWNEAILHFDRAIHWYFPGNPHVKTAITSLWEIGTKAEEADPGRALLAYDAIRGGIFSIRSLYMPHANWVPRVNEKIAHLRAKRQAAEQNVKYDDALKFHRDALARDDRPNSAWGVLASLGFFGWIFSIVGLIWKGFDREGRMHWRASTPWIFSFLLCLAGWALGLVKA